MALRIFQKSEELTHKLDCCRDYWQYLFDLIKSSHKAELREIETEINALLFLQNSEPILVVPEGNNYPNWYYYIVGTKVELSDEAQEEICKQIDERSSKIDLLETRLKAFDQEDMFVKGRYQKLLDNSKKIADFYRSPIDIDKVKDLSIAELNEIIQEAKLAADRSSSS